MKIEGTPEEVSQFINKEPRNCEAFCREKAIQFIQESRWLKKLNLFLGDNDFLKNSV